MRKRGGNPGVRRMRAGLGGPGPSPGHLVSHKRVHRLVQFSSRCRPSGNTSPANSASIQEFFRSVCDSGPSRYAQPCLRTAAEALWEYSARSSEVIFSVPFGSLPPDMDTGKLARLYRALHQALPGELSRE